jgi:vitamin B12 transporter
VFGLTGFRVSRDYDQQDGSDADTARDLSGFDGSRVTFGWLATTDVSPVLQLVYGLDTMTKKASYTNLPAGEADTTISGAFAQAIWAVTPNLDLSATLRGDDHLTFGRFNTGRLALAWRPTEATTIRFAAATGFRAPLIDELFGSYPGQEFVGYPNLTPEESGSFELGIEQAFRNGATLSTTAFRLNIDNLISYAPCPANDPATFDFSCQPGTINTLENVAGQSVRQGIELVGSLPVNDWLDVGLAYTDTDARRPSGSRIGQVAYHDLALSFAAEVTPDLTAGLTVKHVAGRLDDFAVAAMPDYTVVNATVDYDLGQGRSA